MHLFNSSAINSTFKSLIPLPQSYLSYLRCACEVIGVFYSIFMQLITIGPHFILIYVAFLVYSTIRRVPPPIFLAVNFPDNFSPHARSTLP